MGKKGENSKRKKILIIAALVIVLILILFGTKIYFIIYHLLGNDVLINTIPDAENIFLDHGESKEVNFRISILANPFCRVKCNYSFEDLGENKILESGTLDVKVTEPIEKRYYIESISEGAGQKLYRFNTMCIAVKTALCNTEGKLTKKSVLITMDYDYNLEEKKIINYTLSNYTLILESANNLTEEIFILNQRIQKIENISSSEYKSNLTILENENKKITEQIRSVRDLWNSKNILELGKVWSDFNTTFYEANSNFQNLNKSVLYEIENYNSLVVNISLINGGLKRYSEMNFTSEIAIKIDEIVAEFNQLKNNFSSRKNIFERNLEFAEFYKNYSSVEKEIQENQNANKNSTISKKLSDVELKSILINMTENLIFIEYKLENLTSSCCLNGKCFACCDDLCKSNSSLYPIIFIHGHDFSSSVTPEYDLENFWEIKDKLEAEDYINAGSILINVPESSAKGIWGENPNPISVGASYYFDSIKNESVFNVLQEKKDNIDTYAIRLKNIIDSVKYKTNREKVVIVSHSMGGLVARRYIQIFGEDSVDKMILIASPNRGIGAETLKICKLFGEEKECDDMDENSALINKLDRQTELNIPIYNIVGIGCDTYGENGDGIVTNRSAQLNWAKNYYVNGTCRKNEFKYLHSRIIYPEEYPQAYEIIKNILKGNISTS